LDQRGIEREEDAADGNIWNQEGKYERRMLLRVIFGHKRDEERGGWC